MYKRLIFNIVVKRILLENELLDTEEKVAIYVALFKYARIWDSIC